jgi:hypothetical protein
MAGCFSPQRDRGRTWRALLRQLQLFGHVQIVCPGVREAWILSATPTASALSATHDGGLTWQRLTTPCIKEGGTFYEDLAAYTAGQLWSACSAEPASWPFFTIMLSMRSVTRARAYAPGRY